MKTLEHITDIAASPDAVWAVLGDVDRYDEWNPFLTISGAPVAAGARLHVTVRPGGRRMTFHPTVTAYEEGREISWLGRFLMPGLVDGAHTLLVEPLPDGTTRFTQREIFRGILVGFLHGMLRDTDAGFAAMNAALADRAIAIANGRTSPVTTPTLSHVARGRRRSGGGRR